MRTTLLEERQRGTQQLGKLTNQQRLFVQELLAEPTFNLTEAARAAGYSNPSCAGNRLLKNRIIAAAVGKAIRERRERCEWSADQILNKLRAILEVDLTDVIDDQGFATLENVKELPPIIRKCITKIKTHRECVTNENGEVEWITTVELDWTSKDRALELAMRHFGLMEPGLQVHVVPDKVKAQVLVDLLGKIETEGNIVDAEAVSRLAMQ